MKNFKICFLLFVVNTYRLLNQKRKGQKTVEKTNSS